MDYRAFTTAELTTMHANCVVAINRILTGAQAGSIGNSRSFTMPKLSELRETASEISAELANRSDGGGDLISVEFGEAQ